MRRVLRGRGPRVRILSLQRGTSSRRSRGSSCAFRRSPKRTRRITARRSGDRNAFWRRQGEALHAERKLLESLDRIRPRSANPPLLQRFETSSDATRLLCPDCGSRRPARPPRVARNWNFESSSLQQTVCLSPGFASVPGKARVFRHSCGRAGRQCRQRRAKSSNIAPRRGSVSAGRYSSTAVLAGAVYEIGGICRE